jgi:hypothetical protein
LYRPQKFSKLCKAYKDVCRELKTNAMRKYERAH